MNKKLIYSGQSHGIVMSSYYDSWYFLFGRAFSFGTADHATVQFTLQINRLKRLSRMYNRLILSGIYGELKSISYN